MGELFAKTALSQREIQELRDEMQSDGTCIASAMVTLTHKSPGPVAKVRCDRPVDHTGRHRGTSPVMIVSWDQ